MSLLQQVRADLHSLGLKPQHRFGQNFMIDEMALQALADASTSLATAHLDKQPKIVEVGPGTGLLTERLIASGLPVLSVEIDNGFIELLTKKYHHAQNWKLVHGDALASKNTLHEEILNFIDDDPWYLIANLPYDVSLPVMLNAVQTDNPVQSMTVTIQLEAAQRLCAQPGEKAWGASAAIAQAVGATRILRKLGPSTFWPQPKVTSAILCLDVERQIPQGFSQFCKLLFSQRRKHLRGALRVVSIAREDIDALLNDFEEDETVRVEALSPSALVRLYELAVPFLPIQKTSKKRKKE